MTRYNGTIFCPLHWEFPAIGGAVLQICPPPEIYGEIAKPSDGIAISVSMRYGYVVRDMATTQLSLGDDVLITNGSVRGPFSFGSQPAVLVRDLTRDIPDAWIINGTKGAIYDGDGNGVSCDCWSLSPEQRHQCCGYTALPPSIDCWSSSHIMWKSMNPVNFTVKFTGDSTTLDIASANDYNNTGQDILATVHFSGVAVIPAAGDAAFWNFQTILSAIMRQRSPDLRLRRMKRVSLCL